MGLGGIKTTLRFLGMESQEAIEPFPPVERDESHLEQAERLVRKRRAKVAGSKALILPAKILLAQLINRMTNRGL